MKYILGASIALAVIVTNPAAGQTRDENWARCQDDNPDASIGGCTTLIQSGQETPPDLAIAFRNRGVAYRAKGDNDRAIQDYDQAIRLNPTDANAFHNRGNAYRTKGDNDRATQDYDQAIRMLDETIRMNDRDARAFGQRGLVFFQKVDYDRAIADWNTALGLDPRRAESLYCRGVAKLRQGNQVGGDADIVAAIRLHPGVEDQMAAIGVKP